MFTLPSLHSWLDREEALGISTARIGKPLRQVRIGTFMWCLIVEKLVRAMLDHGADT